MKKVLTILVLAIGLSLNAQNTNVTKETKTTTVTVDDGTTPRKVVKTEKTQAVQDIKLKDAKSKKLNKDIKPTPVMVTETTTISGDYILPQELGKTVRYQMDGQDYMFMTDKTGFQISVPGNKEYGVLRKTSNNNYIYRTKDKISISYFDSNGNLVVETYNDADDSITKEVYMRVE